MLHDRLSEELNCLPDRYSDGLQVQLCERDLLGLLSCERDLLWLLLCFPCERDLLGLLPPCERLAVPSPLLAV